MFPAYFINDRFAALGLANFDGEDEDKALKYNEISKKLLEYGEKLKAYSTLDQWLKSKQVVKTSLNYLYVFCLFAKLADFTLIPFVSVDNQAEKLQSHEKKKDEHIQSVINSLQEFDVSLKIKKSSSLIFYFKALDSHVVSLFTENLNPIEQAALSKPISLSLNYLKRHFKIK